MERRVFLKVPICLVLGLKFVQAKDDVKFEELHMHPWSLKDKKYLQDNKQAVMAAVSQNGYVLMYASEKLKDDAEVVKVALSSDPRSVKYASKRLRKVLRY